MAWNYGKRAAVGMSSAGLDLDGTYCHKLLVTKDEESALLLSTLRLVAVWLLTIGTSEMPHARGRRPAWPLFPLNGRLSLCLSPCPFL